MSTQNTFASPNLDGPRFRPFGSPNHQINTARYITSNDPRGYIPVHEYPLNGQWIMMDMDDGYILWTGIWKALGNSKADIVKMVESQPDLASQIRRVRGGYLKIQGTWLPYEVALQLSRRVAWPIRNELIPLFGPAFPSTCLSPDQPGYGKIVSKTSGRPRQRRSNTINTVQPQPLAVSHGPGQAPMYHQFVPPISPQSPSYHPIPDTSGASHSLRRLSDSSLSLPPVKPSALIIPSSRQDRDRERELSPSSYGSRYSPYPSAGPTATSPCDPSSSHSPSAFRTPYSPGYYDGPPLERISLPPLDRNATKSAAPSQYHQQQQHNYNQVTLPPISSFTRTVEGMHNINNSSAVLRRLQSDDDNGETAAISQRRRTLSTSTVTGLPHARQSDPRPLYTSRHLPSPTSSSSLSYHSPNNLIPFQTQNTPSRSSSLSSSGADVYRHSSYMADSGSGSTTPRDHHHLPTNISNLSLRSPTSPLAPFSISRNN